MYFNKKKIGFFNYLMWIGIGILTICIVDEGLWFGLFIIGLGIFFMLDGIIAYYKSR